jgi:hypothetical protein
MKHIILFLFIGSAYSSSPKELWPTDYSVEIGARVQGVYAQTQENQGLYLRRLRLNALFKLGNGQKLVYDIRNDNVNLESEENFVIGDAYWEIPLFNHKVRLFRAKVDVSYSQTSSSKHLFSPDRALSSDFASDFLVQNRRAANIQINKKLANLYYQVVIANGVQAGDLEDQSMQEISEVASQKLTYGAKLRYFFFGNGKVQDTFYGTHNTMSLGLGHFRNDRIEVKDQSLNISQFSFSRDLTNIELSISYNSFRFLSEYFTFNNDLCDLSQSEKEDVLCDSTGSYSQFEYIINSKWSPYVRYDSLARGNQKEATTISKTIGLNHYYRDSSMRFGVSYKKTENGDRLQNSDDETYALYTMIDF